MVLDMLHGHYTGDKVALLRLVYAAHCLPSVLGAGLPDEAEDSTGQNKRKVVSWQVTVNLADGQQRCIPCSDSLTRFHLPSREKPERPSPEGGTVRLQSVLCIGA